MTSDARITRSRTNHRQVLFALALANDGVVTVADAQKAGVPRSTLSYHTKTGALQRIGSGVYRLPYFPVGPNSAIVSAAAALGNDALLSHESALKLYDVCDVRPSRIHFTVSRNRRYTRPPQADVDIHTTSQPIDSLEQVLFEGFRATSLARSIVDSAKNGTSPEQIVMAVREGLNSGLVTASELKRAIKSSPKRVAQLIQEGERSGTKI